MLIKRKRHQLDTRDVVAAAEHAIVNLKRRPYFRYPLEALGIALVVALVIFIGRNSLTRAEVEKFYPTACLGTWQNAALAAGIPEAFGADGIAPDETNAAQAAGGYVTCGNFVPPEYEAAGTIQSVVATFVLRVEGGALTRTEAVPEPEATGDGSAPSLFPEEGGKGGPGGASIEPASPEPEPGPVPAPEEAPPPETPPAGGELETTTSTATSSFHFSPFAFFVPRAFAEESTSSSLTPPVPPTSTVTSTAPEEAPPPETPPAGGELETATSTATSSGTLAEPQPEETPYAVPLPPDEHFLKITFTINGTAWFELVRVSDANWPNLTMLLPITRWEELEELQVSVEEIPTLVTPYPTVYLDGVIVTVRYERLVEPTGAVTELAGAPRETGDGPVPSEGQDDEAAAPGFSLQELFDRIFRRSQEFSVAVTSWPPPPRRTDEERRRDTDFSGTGAGHSCVADPFSQTVGHDDVEQFSIALTPSYEDAPFEIFLGNLPRGVIGRIDPPTGIGAAAAQLTFGIAPDAIPGSLNLVIIDLERQPDGSTKTALCQVNLVVR